VLVGYTFSVHNFTSYLESYFVFLSQINKLIRILTLSKYVWITLVVDLIARCLMDALSDPDYIHYSGLELREAVKRVACGPTWATSRSGPAIHCQLSVESPDIAPGNNLSTWTTYVKLLPGGRFFTLENYDGRLECWSIMNWAMRLELLGKEAHDLRG
jgi:hypothetical protein